MADAAGTSVPEELEGLLDALRERAPAWLGQVDAVDISIRRCDQRPRSTLLEVDLGGSSGPAHHVVVKIPKVDDGPVDRRLVQPVRDAGEKSRLEHETLLATGRHFEARADRRFGSVTVYGHLPEWSALVVGWVDGAALDRILRAGPRAGLWGAERTEVLGNVGAWLAEFHSIEMDGMEPRAGAADEIAADLHMLLDVLDEMGRLGDRHDPLRTLVGDVASSRVLGHDIRAGLGHGDFAARNVIVGEGSRITVLDSLGRFRVPVHEDMAYFLSGLTTGSTRFARRHLPMSSAEIGRMRAAALAGYGMADDPVLWLFELRALLDVWQSIARRPRRSGVNGRLHTGVTRAREQIVAREVRRTAERLAVAR